MNPLDDDDCKWAIGRARLGTVRHSITPSLAPPLSLGFALQMHGQRTDREQSRHPASLRFPCSLVDERRRESARKGEGQRNREGAGRIYPIHGQCTAGILERTWKGRVIFGRSCFLVYFFHKIVFLVTLHMSFSSIHICLTRFWPS